MRCAVRQHAEPRMDRTPVFPRLLQGVAEPQGSRRHRSFLGHLRASPAVDEATRQPPSPVSMHRPRPKSCMPISRIDISSGRTSGLAYFLLSEDEVIAGRNNKHLDFRVSVLKLRDGNGSSVVVSTVCRVHNLAGKLYLSFVVPFITMVYRSHGERARGAKVVAHLRRATSD